MSTDIPWADIGAEIAAATGRRGPLEPVREVPGGDINRAVCARLGDAEFFIKLNEAHRAAMFEAEALGLEELAAGGALRVPAPVCHGRAGATAFLVLEHLHLVRHGDERALGAGLAALHRVTHRAYGWRRDNTIGTTPQINTHCADWTGFWCDHRLGYQLGLAQAGGHGGRLLERGARLLADLDRLLAGHRPPASLLHGDLWAGNHAFETAGAPVIFDPAVYFGDRETDLAMTELFGGFGADFHAAYRDHYPVGPGYRLRRTLYNLYHVLNHLNLFGGAYRSQAERMIDTLLAELG